VNLQHNSENNSFEKCSDVQIFIVKGNVC